MNKSRFEIPRDDILTNYERHTYSNTAQPHKPEDWDLQFQITTWAANTHYLIHNWMGDHLETMI